MHFEKIRWTLEVRRCNSADYGGGASGKIPDGCLMGQNSGTRDLACAAWVKLMVPYNILYTQLKYYIRIRYIIILYIREEVRLTPLDYIRGIQILSATTSDSHISGWWIGAGMPKRVSKNYLHHTRYILSKYNNNALKYENHCWNVLRCTNVTQHSLNCWIRLNYFSFFVVVVG